VVRHYEVTCCVDGQKITQDIWVVEGPLPDFFRGSISLGQVIHVREGMSGWPPSWGSDLPHELVHAFSQSHTMGWSYLLNLGASYAVEGYYDSYFEEEARHMASEFARDCQVRRK
jgi:hypothetical protein